MKQLLLFSLLSCVFASSLFAGTEIELSGGPSTKTIQGDEGEDDIKIKSTDMSLYAGYRYKFVSFGLIATQKNYDMSEAADSLKPIAQDFYSDEDGFPGGASMTSGKGSGSLKGLVYGPQLTLAATFKYLQPYLRVAYQMGTLKGISEYKSTGEYQGMPLSYDFKVEDDRKATFTQIGLGLRVPINMAYILLDFGTEKLSMKSNSFKISQKALINGSPYAGTSTFNESADDKGNGPVIKLGFGYEI